MDATIDTVLLMIMVGYAFVNGAGVYCFKIGIQKVKGIDLTLKELLKNPIKTFYYFLKVPVMLLAAALVVIGFVIYQYALDLYGIVNVKPLTNLNLFFILLFGFILIKEKVTKREIFGLLALVFGVVCVSLFAESSGASTFINYSNLIIFSTVTITVSLGLVLITILKDNKKRNEFILAVVSATCFSLGVIFNNAVYRTGGSLANSTSLIYNPFTYLLVLAYFFGVFIEVVAFSDGRLVIVGPILNTVGVGLPVVGAVLVFNEALLVTAIGLPWSLIKIFGIILVTIGAIAIYPRVEKIKELDVNQ